MQFDMVYRRMRQRWHNPSSFTTLPFLLENQEVASSYKLSAI